MLILLSPSKTMNFSRPVPDFGSTEAKFLKEASILVPLIREMDVAEIGKIMGISGPLAARTKSAFMEWNEHHNIHNARPAIFAFAGDVYDGLNATLLKREDIQYAQQHIAILSGLYGILRPLDLMMPYRLELGLKWKTEQFDSLYAFWKHKVHKYLFAFLQESGQNIILNLASAEYFKILDTKKLNVRVISPVFMEHDGEKLKMVSIFAKKARGMMAQFVIQHQINDPEELTAFNEEGYHYLPGKSSENKPVFAR